MNLSETAFITRKNSMDFSTGLIYMSALVLAHLLVSTKVILGGNYFFLYYKKLWFDVKLIDVF